MLAPWEQTRVLPVHVLAAPEVPALVLPGKLEEVNEGTFESLPVAGAVIRGATDLIGRLGFISPLIPGKPQQGGAENSA
jgi:hypothetical protein